jgi:carboxypeptidase C (cathepsin A)
MGDPKTLVAFCRWAIEHFPARRYWLVIRNHGGGSLSGIASDDYTDGMITNPKLLVQVENGYYDLATPFFATEHTMEHLGLPEALQKNVKLDYYTAGHMMYLQDQDRVSLHNQIANLIERATQP